MTQVVSSEKSNSFRENYTKNTLVVEKPTLVMVQSENVHISRDDFYMNLNDETMGVLVEPGVYHLICDSESNIHTQIIHGDNFNFSGNYVINIEDCRRAAVLLNIDIPILNVADRLIAISCSDKPKNEYFDSQELFTYKGVKVYSCFKEHEHEHEHDKIYDSIVIGAGPSGTSAAISLKKNDMNVYWIGEPLSFWLRNIQPTPLRSVKSATNIYTNTQGFSFSDFCTRFGLCGKVKIEFYQFVAYYFYLLNAFNIFPHQEKATNVYHEDGNWHVEVLGVNGKKTIIAKNVINATGMGMHPNVPEVLTNLPKNNAAHVSYFATNAFPENKKIAVIGGAQSGLEYALQADCFDNEVTLYVRNSISYRNLHDPSHKIYRYLAANCEKYLRFLPVRLRTRVLNYLLEGTCDPQTEEELKNSNIKIKENTAIKSCDLLDDGRVFVKTNNGSQSFDLIIAATGYRYDINDVKYLDGMLNSKKHVVVDRYPKVNKNAMLRNAPKGMYFTGFSCLYTIGFKSQFVNGTNIIVKRILNDIKRNR